MPQPWPWRPCCAHWQLQLQLLQPSLLPRRPFVFQLRSPTWPSLLFGAEPQPLPRPGYASQWRPELMVMSISQINRVILMRPCLRHNHIRPCDCNQIHRYAYKFHRVPVSFAPSGHYYWTLLQLQCVRQPYQLRDLSTRPAAAQTRAQLIINSNSS